MKKNEIINACLILIGFYFLFSVLETYICISQRNSDHKTIWFSLLVIREVVCIGFAAIILSLKDKS